MSDVASLRAELTGSDTCTAADLTVRASAPVLTMCREMLAAGLDPDRALDVYRNGVLSLRIRSIGEAAKLDVMDDGNGPRFVRYRPAEREHRGVGEPRPCAKPSPRLLPEPDGDLTARKTKVRA
jgi:hypothetical protein